jgi:hypothetical protein
MFLHVTQDLSLFFYCFCDIHHYQRYFSFWTVANAIEVNMNLLVEKLKVF